MTYSSCKRYQYDTDKDMIQLKFVGLDGTALGILNWYAVHLTSMNNTNSYISSDNKGYSALLFETEMNGPNVLPGKVTARTLGIFNSKI